MTGAPIELIELAKVMHNAYENAARSTGWQTQMVSRKAWDEIPEANRATMIYAVADLLLHIGYTGETLVQGPGKDQIVADRDFVIQVDSLCSLIASRYRNTRLPDDILTELSHLSGRARKLYEAKP